MVAPIAPTAQRPAPEAEVKRPRATFGSPRKGKVNRSPLEGRLAISVVEAARLLSIGKTTLYEAISAGEFPHLKIRGRVVVPTAALEAFVAGATPLLPRSSD